MMLQITQVWMGLHRSLLTLFMAFAVTATGVILNERQKDPTIEMSNTDSTAYIMVVMMIVGIFSFMFTAVFSFQVMRLPISVWQIPWNSNASRILYAREVFKVLIVVQDYFIQAFDLSSNQTAFSLY